MSGPAVYVLGPSLAAEWESVSGFAELPTTARIVIVSQRDPSSVLTSVRSRAPAAVVIAYVDPAQASESDALFLAGFDDVAVGRLMLTQRLKKVLDGDAATTEHALLARRYDSFVQLVGEIANAPGLQDVLRLAVLRLSELFSIDRVTVVILDGNRDLGFVVMEREQASLDNVVIRVADYPELQQIIASKNPLLISDVFGDALLEGARERLTQANNPHRAAVLFPLVRKNEVMGALFLRSKNRLGAVSDDLLKVGGLIAQVTAVAVGHALEHDSLMSERRVLERTEAEALEQAEGLRELREFLDQAKDGILVTDFVGVVRYANEAAATILRVPRESLHGKRFLDLIASKDHDNALLALADENVGDSGGYIDLNLLHEAPHSVVISAAIRPIRRPEGVFISFRDVTGLREIEAELRQTKEFLENLIQSSVDAIIATDTDGRVILFNRAAEQILGYTAREVVGRANVSMFYPHGEAWDVMRKVRSEAFGGRGRLQLVRKELIAKNGETVPVNLTAAVIYEGNREVATVSIFSDLRERRRMEEKLSQVQKKLQMSERQAVAVELAGMAAHELNQPLTSILGYAEMLKRKITETDPSRKAVDVISRETERMAGIVRKLGQITAYQTKPYVGTSQILDLGKEVKTEPKKENDE